MIVGAQLEGFTSSTIPFLVPGSYVHLKVYWEEIEKTPHLYTWPVTLDTQIGWVSKYGCKLILGVKGCPVFYRKNKQYKCSPPKSEHYIEFATFVQALCLRYHPEYVEIWNEPESPKQAVGQNTNLYGCWGNKKQMYFGGLNYGELLITTRALVRPIGTKIIGGALLLPNDDANMQSFWTGVEVAERLYKKQACDVTSYHSYIHFPNPEFELISQRLQLMQKKTTKPLFISETAVLSNVVSKEFYDAQVQLFNFMVNLPDIIGWLWYTLRGNNWYNSDMIGKEGKRLVWDRLKEYLNA